MLLRYILVLLLIAAVSAESKIDSMIGSTEEIIEKGPRVINKIFEEGKILNEKFNEHVVDELLRDIKKFREALRDCEKDAKNPQNSLLMLQNFTRLIQISYQAYQKLASTNYTEGLVAIQESLKNIREEMNSPSPKRTKGYKPLEIDYFR